MTIVFLHFFSFLFAANVSSLLRWKYHLYKLYGIAVVMTIMTTILPLFKEKKIDIEKNNKIYILTKQLDYINITTSYIIIIFVMIFINIIIIPKTIYI